MRLDEQRIDTLAQRLVDRDLIDRHRRRTQQEYETIFGVTPTPEAGRNHLGLIFRRVIQARSIPLTTNQYLRLLDTVSPEKIIEKETHQSAFDTLRNQRHIGQKIANEFLRHVVDVFGVRRSEWVNQLDVALDTNVVQALVKTGAIALDDSEHDRVPERLVNTNPESDPTKLIGYQEVQDALQAAAIDACFPQIVFDELWLEHRHFIADRLLQSESEFNDLILDRYRYDEKI